MSLEKFPETFSLEEKIKKSFFPFHFNKIENLNYNEIYPGPEYFGSDYFTVEKKLEFDKWYQEIKNKKFNFKKEFEKYCVNDVNILAQGCLKFRKIIMHISKTNDLDTGIDPFRVSTTLASLVHFIYRRNFMKKDKIAVIPANGYSKQNYSQKSLSWLKFISERDHIFINHARNGGEYKIGKYFLDGYCKDTNTGYEFHGCFYHGCPRCYLNRNLF
jgi:hypothetical protein